MTPLASRASKGKAPADRKPITAAEWLLHGPTVTVVTQCPGPGVLPPRDTLGLQLGPSFPLRDRLWHRSRVSVSGHSVKKELTAMVQFPPCSDIGRVASTTCLRCSQCGLDSEHPPQLFPLPRRLSLHQPYFPLCFYSLAGRHSTETFNNLSGDHGKSKQRRV